MNQVYADFDKLNAANLAAGDTKERAVEQAYKQCERANHRTLNPSYITTNQDKILREDFNENFERAKQLVGVTA